LDEINIHKLKTEVENLFSLQKKVRRKRKLQAVMDEKPHENEVDENDILGESVIQQLNQIKNEKSIIIKEIEEDKVEEEEAVKGTKNLNQKVVNDSGIKRKKIL
jgi:hypothetical protein